MKSNKSLFWVIGVVAVAMCVFVYIMVGEAPRTLPKITLSYFVDEQEVADSVAKRLYQEINQNQSQSYWIGVEPDRAEHLKIVLKLKEVLEKNAAFQKIIVDEELALSKDFLKEIKATDVVPLKENLYKLGPQLQDYEKQKISYLVVTASIYSSSLLKKNPIHLMREQFQIKPMTFSIGYFPISPADEKNMQFICNTEDHTGTSDWGCVVVNKSRAVRRKISSSNQKDWLGLMDLTGETDYMLLLKKK